MNEITPNAAARANTGATTRAARIEHVLRAAFAPTQLELRDESHLHAGHAHKEERGESETHFRLTIASPAFAGLSRVDQQRLINKALADEFASGLHALALKIIC